ncbi:MAG: hypothetical protein Q9198_007524, partial [Flavoplaca austrocitrina]
RLPSRPSTMAAEKFGTVVFLDSFNLPEVPVEYRERDTISYISRIELDNYAYQEALRLPFSIPELPQKIHNLILNGFSFGYPAGFLAQLGQKLPDLETLTLHFQLFGGMDESTWEDAVTFITSLKELQRLNLLDVMPTQWLRSGFFATIGKSLTSRAAGLEKVTISFTTSNEPDEFLRQVPFNDLQYFIMPSLRILCLNVSPADTDASSVGPDGNPVKQPLGVLPIPSELTPQSGILSALLTGRTAPTHLKYLDLSLFTLTVDQVVEVLQKHTSLNYLKTSLYLVPEQGPKERLMKGLSVCSGLEEVRIIYYPSLGFYRAVGNASQWSLRSLAKNLQFSDTRPPYRNSRKYVPSAG